MNEKKAPGRFTIQFNMDDPQQRVIAELLEKQGRRKAQFLTNAVLCYMEKTQIRNGLPSEISEAALERMILSVIKKHSQSASTQQADTSTPKKNSFSSEPEANVDSEKAIQAIANTLAAFQNR